MEVLIGLSLYEDFYGTVLSINYFCLICLDY